MSMSSTVDRSDGVPPREAQESAARDLAQPRKKKAKLVLAALVGVASLVGAGAYLLSLGKESTDDAQIEGHILSIAARVPGQVGRVLVQDNQVVNAGDVLVELDRAELEARLETAKADMASAQAQLELAQAQLELTERTVSANLKQARGGVAQAASGVSTSKAQQDQAKADLTAAESRHRLASIELQRVQGLFASGSISQAEVDARQAAYDQAQAAVDQARARIEASQASITGTYAGVEQAEGRLAGAQAGPQQVQAAKASVQLAAARLQQAQAALHLAELNLSYATIRAPLKGMVARRTVEVGNMVSPERALLAIVPLNDVWVVANFKEDQVGQMHSGQQAIFEVDAFGGKKFSGHVESLAAGTGARFALLPPDNATGNFVKVVQRIPVLIRIDDHPQGIEFRPGMSVDVTVRTR